jgi:hypothetical protein
VRKLIVLAIAVCFTAGALGAQCPVGGCPVFSCPRSISGYSNTGRTRWTCYWTGGTIETGCEYDNCEVQFAYN